MSLKIKQSSEIISPEQSTIECNEIVNQPFIKQITNKAEIIDILLDLIDSVDINNDSVLIKLKKSLLLQSENIVLGANNLNIQLAGRRVELQPRISNKTNKKLRN